MALADKRIRSRDNRLTLHDVYGADPFASVRNLNQPIEDVTKTLKEVRLSLGKKVSNAKGLVKGLRGMFDATSLKDSLMDKLGVTTFKRNIGDLKRELNEWADMLGIKTRGTIDRLNSSSSHTLTGYETDFYAYFNNQLPSSGGSDAVDKLNEGVSTVQYPQVPGTVDPNGSTSGNVGSPQTVAPTVPGSTTGAMCGMPYIKPSTTATSALQIPTTDVVQTVVPAYPSTVVIPPVIEPAVPVDKIDPVQALIAIALIALALNDYGSLDKLPDWMKPLIAELLIAIGIDLQSEAAVLAGLSLGDIQDLEDKFPDLFKDILPFITNVTSLVNIINTAVSDIKPMVVTKPVMDELKANLPVASSISPLPISVPIQMVVALAVISTPHKRRYYSRTNYAHTYHPHIS